MEHTKMTDETFPHEIWADLDHWIEGPAASDLRAQGYMKYIRSDHVADMLKAEREKALREAASLSWLCFHRCDVEVDVVTAEDILALISEDKTDG